MAVLLEGEAMVSGGSGVDGGALSADRELTLKVPEAATEPQRRPPEMESRYQRAKVELVRLRAKADPEGVRSQTEPWGGRLESSGRPASPWHC